MATTVTHLLALVLLCGGVVVGQWFTTRSTTTEELPTTTTISPDDEGCFGEEIAFKFFESPTLSRFTVCQQMSRQDCLTVHEAEVQCPCVCYRRKRFYNTYGVNRQGYTRSAPRTPYNFENPDPGNGGGGVCFAGDTVVRTDQGPLTMQQLFARSHHDPHVQVEVFDKTNGVALYAPVRYWIHAEPNTTISYLVLRTETGRKLTISKQHVIYRSTQCHPHGVGRRRSEEPVEREAVFAGRIRVGDCLLTSDGGVDRVTGVDVDVMAKGVYAPLTRQHATIVVEGLVASCYAGHENERLQAYVYEFFFFFRSLLLDWLFHSGSADVTQEVPVARLLLVLQDAQHYLLAQS